MASKEAIKAWDDALEYIARMEKLEKALILIQEAGFIDSVILVGWPEIMEKANNAAEKVKELTQHGK